LFLAWLKQEFIVDEVIDDPIFEGPQLSKLNLHPRQPSSQFLGVQEQLRDLRGVVIVVNVPSGGVPGISDILHTNTGKNSF
jgi:hypothetical protein